MPLATVRMTTPNRAAQEEQNVAVRAADPIYTPGTSDSETQRLIAQSQIYDAATRRLMMDAGVESGMRVLDLESGACHVAMVAASVVGPTGQVVGVDRNPAILATARRRVQEERVRRLMNRMFRMVVHMRESRVASGPRPLAHRSCRPPAKRAPW